MNVNRMDSAKERFTNFSRRFSKQSRADRKLPPDMRKDYKLQDPEANRANGIPTSPAGNGVPTSPAANGPPPSTPASPTSSGGAGVAPYQDLSDNSPQAAPSARTSTTAHHSNPSTSSQLSGPYTLRPPALHRRLSSIHASQPEFQLPDLPWLCGTWHVTHSTLPMWRDKKNVRITYTRLQGEKLDDLVTYQSVNGSKVQKVHGVDVPKGDGGYQWRGRGMLKVASSRWEVLGWGGGGSKKKGDMPMESTGAANPLGENTSEQWVVTFFAKTLFTPAGIDIYSRRGKGLSPRTLQKVQQALKRVAQETGKTDFASLVDQIFEVKRDDTRNDMVDMADLQEKAEEEAPFDTRRLTV